MNPCKSILTCDVLAVESRYEYVAILEVGKYSARVENIGCDWLVDTLEGEKLCWYNAKLSYSKPPIERNR